MVSYPNEVLGDWGLKLFERTRSVRVGAIAAVAAALVLLGGAGAGPAAAQQGDQLTLVIGGDLGLGGSREPVDERGARRHGRLHPWDEMTAGLSGLISGDVNFANLETVVTKNNRLSAADKTFAFRSHPAGVRHLVNAGFNVFSTANNHVIDYGAAGMQDTLSELAALRQHGLLAFPGIGATRDEAGRPALVEMKQRRLLFSAIGIGGRLPSRNSPGILGYHSPQDFDDAVQWLAAEEAHYRVLSVHYGTELSVRPGQDAIKKFRDRAVRDKAVDLVVGHHAHVPAGVQDVGGRLIFYGLGNLLHPGMQDMSRFDRCRDYGIIAKLHLAANDKGGLTAKAVEVWPLDQMHLKAQPMTGAKGKQRIEVLNKLAQELDDAGTGARGVRFLAREDGSGLACLDGAAAAGGRIGDLCRAWDPAAVAARPASGISCSDRTLVSASRRSPGGQPRRKRAEPSLFETMFGAP